MEGLQFSLLSIMLLLLLSGSASQQLLLPLTHSLSHAQNPNSTTHLLKISSLRSAARHRGRGHHHRRREVSMPLSAGSDYTLSLSLGPSTTVDVYMDTGSDLVWFPCSPFECILCEGKPTTPTTPPPPPPNSSLVSCASPICSAAHSSLPSSDLCAIAGCPLDDIETSSCKAKTSPCPSFYYAYGDGSLVANLRRGPVALTADVRVDKFAFACAHSALAEPVGVAGFGGGELSLPAQLAATRFSYCLVSHSFQPRSGRLHQPSPLILGRSAEPDRAADAFVYTPILHNPKHPYFYSVGLEGVTVGSTKIKTGADLATVDGDGNGGMVVDSGTTFTMLPAKLHVILVKLFDRAMTQAGFKRAVQAEESTGLGPCYGYSGGEEGRRVPGMALHFAGNASVALPRRNYFLGFEQEGKRVGCLMVMSGGEEEGGGGGGPAATLGNYQQQGFEVAYDLAGRRVGFARRRCGEMWDALARGGR